MGNVFVANYENIKLSISNPTLNNYLLILIFVLLSAIAIKKQKYEFLDRSQTDQLKGAAIFFVVLGHLWTHVSKSSAEPVYGGEAVSLFLILSGFGLTLSTSNRSLTLKNFTSRRVSRVMVPYWIVTSLILVLDYMVLDRSYSPDKVALTYLGLNFDMSLRYLDYVRWYITLLIINYLLFYILFKYLPPIKAVAGLVVSSGILYLLRRAEIIPFGSLHQIFAFPIGCLVALCIDRLKSFLSYPKNIFSVLLICVGLLVAIRYLSGFYSINTSLPGKVIALLMVNTYSLLLCLLLISAVALIGSFGFCSKLLAFLGIISYEIFLIHGVLLVKYNPVFVYLENYNITLIFIIYFVFISIISIVLSRVNSKINKYMNSCFQ